MWVAVEGKLTARRVLAGATLLLVAAVAGLALLVDVRAAAVVLGVGMLGMAGGRALLPEDAVLAARGRRFDIVLLVCFGLALLALSPWGLAVLE